MLVVIAQPEEMKLVKELGYDKYPVLITGVGGVNVIRALKHLPRDIEITNIGYCGSNGYKIGNIIGVYQVSTLHEKATFEEPKIILCGSNMGVDEVAKCYTSTDFVTHTDIKEPCVFDMELAFIGEMFDNVYAIKVVSDNLNKKEYDDNLRGHTTKSKRTRKQT